MIAPEGMYRLIKRHFGVVVDYVSLLAGSAGRLVLSLAYFVSVANALTIAEFGLFATASATGIVLSRIAGLGFVSPLYRIATVKPRLIGTYTTGLLVAFGLSVPLVALAAWAFYALFFAGEMHPAAFAAIVVAEVAFWRVLEIVVIVNNGIGRFARGAAIVIVGSAVRAAAAVGFATFGHAGLLAWSLVYMAANGVAMAIAVLGFYPTWRLRLAPRLYASRWRDSLSVAGAEIVFYLQSELDKLLVLSFGGPHIAGIYALVMRLVDLTALPVRSFNTMVVQKLMKTPRWLDGWRIRCGLEGLVAAVSVLGLAALGGLLHVYPDALGHNVAEAAPLVLIALLVPAFRNLVEYQSELLYAQGKTTSRAAVLAVVGLIKAALLILLFRRFPDETEWILGLNGLFFALWLASAAMTYTLLDWTGFSHAGRFRPIRQPAE